MRPLSLVVQTGPDRGRSVPLGAAPVTIGRGTDQTLQLADGAVSRHHLTVSGSPEGLRIDAIAGVNPCWTLREGRRVQLRVGDHLAPGVALTLGNTTLMVQAQAPAPAPARLGGRSSRTMEIDATRVISQPSGGNRLAARAALADRLARCGSLQAVYRTATDWAIEAIPAARAHLLTADGADILGVATAGRVADLALSSAILERVLGEQRAFFLGDLLAEPELADRRSVQARGIVGAMAAPAEALIFYVEWGPAEAARGRHDEETLLLLVCAAQLVAAIGDSAEERKQLKAAARSRGGGQGGHARDGRMIGASAAMRRLEVFLERVAATPSTVLLLGESGTGKELAASTIHALSPRAQAPFVAINCAAIAENLLESELFGHERGAFTGAVNQHEGVFVRAHGGTLFMDEVGELSPGAQARMLRVLENRTLTRVGGTKELAVDVRLVAATHRDLPQMVRDGKFREDLLYRLSVIQTRLPPLRERREDIPALAAHFADLLGESIGRRVEEISSAALEVLSRYRWPGNVRELRNVIERALVLGDGAILDVDDLAPELAHAAPLAAMANGAAGLGGASGAAPVAVRPLAELEREAIAAALAATEGNKARAAALLGIDRSTLYRKLKDLGIK
ncbi:MAG: sigma 54-dependent Fis family transcriptional regulator [Myxococcales bacterium]|nr:sigma 54-dependent Fis family transcriptional regulator [Myxococcales bacterium]